MLDEMSLKNTIREIIEDLVQEGMEFEKSEESVRDAVSRRGETIEENSQDGFVEDLTKETVREQFYVPNPHDREGYLKMKQSSNARLGIWRAGPRPTAKAYLRFWADHSAAQNTVWSDVDPSIIEDLGLVALDTIAEDKEEYIKDPNTGKELTKESAEKVEKNCTKNANVQVVFADGLSSGAIEANARDILPALEQGLDSLGLTYSKPFYVTNGRVAVSDEIGEITGADVVVMLVGERPGLNSTQSMGAYMAYKPKVKMQESNRTVISNIHDKGTVPVEAGAQIAELCKTMIEYKMSGVDLQSR